VNTHDHRERIRACAACLRRSWLLTELIGPLDLRARDRGRLHDLLALDDETLLAAVGGRRRRELHERLTQFRVAWLQAPAGVSCVCRHDRLFPATLRSRAAPRALFLTGGARRLGRLTAAPIVTLAGAARASDYGGEMARSLGRGLAAAGVTVASGLSDGLGAAAPAAG
jgi:DNA processing protein